MNRYQHQNWYIKLWRRRYYLLIPFTAYSIWKTGEKFKVAWSLAIGLTQVKMNWLYDWKKPRPFNPKLTNWLNERDFTTADWKNNNVPFSVIKEACLDVGNGILLDNKGYPTFITVEEWANEH